MSFREINLRKINSHVVNAFRINLSRDQLWQNQSKWDQWASIGIQVNKLPVSGFVELNFVFDEYSVPVKWALYKHAATAVGKAHPNVYKLVNVIKREEATSKLKLQQYESGAVLPARRRKVRERERRLTTLFDRFNNGELSLDDFLEAVKHQTGF